jgi:HPt (histidine-containing phosphotransfer) domain-containing protein
MKAGMTDYLSKPFDEEQLLEVTAKWLGEGKLSISANAAVESTQKLYDLGMLENIAQGNPKFIDEMIELFIGQAKKSMSEIWEAYHNNQLDIVSKIAHRLKPSIDNMGIASLKEKIREVETNTEALKASQTLEDHIKKLDEVLSEVILQLKER